MSAIACASVSIAALYLSWVEGSPLKTTFYFMIAIFALVGATIP